jgi:proteasome lid subunit RPN8/RPN11
LDSIDWQDSQEVEPLAGSIADFCAAHDLDWPGEAQPGLPLVFIHHAALESLHDFLAHDLQREHGGVLVGQPFQDAPAGRPYLVIHAAIPALETTGSSVHLQFTPETWDYISGLIEENYPDQLVVGWYHSHPGLGVFMSGTDRATQQAFYHHAWNVAVVADPVARRTGWFAGPHCAVLPAAQVFTFGEPPTSTGEIEAAYRRRQAWPAWRWLLPFGLLTGAALALAWWLVSRRLPLHPAA